MEGDSDMTPDRTIAALLTLTLLAGCSYARQVHRSSNLMAYLDLDRGQPRPATEGVRLQLPLRIGIAFVPPGQRPQQFGRIDAVIPGASE
jgi:hypothetical protein